MNPLSAAGFLAMLESALQHRRVAFSRAAAIAFVESCWELIDDNPDVDNWADRFCETGAVEVPCSSYTRAVPARGRNSSQ